jgi:hypothetical protein
MSRIIHSTPNKQLILLNDNDDEEEYTLQFSLSSQQPFYISVLDEDTLNNSSELMFQTVNNGLFEASIPKKANRKYFILIKSDQECDVKLDLKPEPEQKAGSKSEAKAGTREAEPTDKDFKSYLIVILALIMIMIGVYVYSKYGSGGGSGVVETVSLLDEFRNNYLRK